MYYSLIRATSWNVVGYLYLIMASLIATPFLVHSLGLAMFAQYSLILATLALVSSFNLGLPQAVVRSLSHEHAHPRTRETIWATSSLLFILTGLVAGSIAALAAYYFHVRHDALALIFAIGLMANIVAHYTTLPHAEGHFGYFNVKTIIVGTGNTLLAAYLAWRGEGITAILSSQLLCYLLTLLPLAYFSLKYFQQPWRYQPSLAVAKSLINFGLKNQAGTLVGQVQAQYGKYLLTFTSPINLSAYVIAAGLVQKAAGGVVQVATAIYPSSARVTLSHQFTKLYYRLQLSLFSFGLLCIFGFRIWGFGFLSWWLGVPEIVSLVYSVLNILVLYLAILILTPLPSTILDGQGRPELTSLFALITTTIEVSVAFILFPRFGYLAPAYAGILALALTTPVLLITAHRMLQSKP